MNTANISKFHKEQISHLQQAIWSLEKAKLDILFAKGNLDVGRCYLENIDALIEGINEDIDNIHAEYESSDIND